MSDKIEMIVTEETLNLMDSYNRLVELVVTLENSKLKTTLKKAKFNIFESLEELYKAKKMLECGEEDE